MRIDAAGVGAAADGVREADARALDLAGAGVAAELVHELDDLTERRRAERLALRQQAAARVDRAARRRARSSPSASSSRLLARRAQAELLVREQLAGRVGVLALDDVEVVGADARPPRTRRAAASVDGGVMSVSSMPDERRRLAEHAARQVRAQHAPTRA